MGPGFDDTFTRVEFWMATLFKRWSDIAYNRDTSGLEGIQRKLIGDIENRVRIGGRVSNERESCWSLNDWAVAYEPFGVGAQVGNDYSIFIDRYGTVVFRAIGAVSLQCYEFCIRLSVHDDSARTAGDVYPTLRHH